MAKMAKRISNSLLILIVMVAVVGAVAAQEASPMLPAHAPSTGCHQHETAPVPEPTSYRCCQSGHDSAIVQASISAQPDSAIFTARVEWNQIPTPTTPHRTLHNLAGASADPPIIAPLRV
jgi:hypothetical protein